MTVRAVPPMDDEDDRPAGDRGVDSITTTLIISGQFDRLDDMAPQISARVDRDAHLYWLLLTRAGGVEHAASAMRHLAGLLVRRMGAEGAPPPIDLGPAVEVGEHGAGDEIDPSAVRAIVTAAGAVVRHHVLAEWQRLAPRDIRALEELLDQLSAGEEAVIKRMTAELAASEGGANDERQMARDALLRRLVEEELWGEPDVVLESAAELDMHVTPPLWLVALTERASSSADRSGFAERVVVCFREIGTPSVRPVALHAKSGRTPSEILIVPRAGSWFTPDARERLGRVCEDLDLLAVDADAPTLGDVHPASAELLQAVPILAACSLQYGRVMALDDLAEDQAASGLSVGTKERLLVSAFVDYLGDAKGPARLATLEAVLATMRPNWVAAAAAMRAAGHKVTPRTVSERVSDFEEATGLSFNRDVGRIDLRLRLARLYAHRLPAPDDPRWASGDIEL